MIHNVRDKNEKLLARFVFRPLHDSGVRFFSEAEHALQVGTLTHAEGHVVQPHLHNPVPRSSVGNQEVLYLLSGSMIANIYDENKVLVHSVRMNPHDFVILFAGGHGFKALTDVEVFEVKQGPYVGEADKERFYADASVPKA